MLKSLKRQGRRLSSRLRLALSNAPANEKTHEITYDAFRRLIEIAPEGITIHQNNCLVYVNQAAAEQYGANDPEEILGHDVREFIESVDRERLAVRVKQLYGEDGRGRLTRFRRSRLDGSILDVESVAVAIHWKGRPAILSLVRDITARVQAKERLEGFLETATNWLWETDVNHRFTFLSSIRNDTGLKQSDVVGKTRWELVGADIDQDEHWQAHLADLEARRPFDNFEYIRPSFESDNEERCALVSGQPVFDPSGIFMGYRGTARDITEQKEAERTIAHMAMHDMLTQLPNRAYFTDELDRACSAAKRDGTNLAVLYLDLDHFKDINDSHGHSIGDKVLIEVANRLKSCLRGGDLIARFGGDDFVMIVTSPYDLNSIGCLADRITKAIAASCSVDGVEVRIGISVGVAIYPDDGLDTERILASADLALYEAKKAGRGTWRVFDRHLQEQLQVQRTLDQQLRRALDRQQFELHYQPLIDIADDRISGFEALIRWNHPDHGQMQPDAFIPAAEQNRLIIPLTEWVLQEAATQLQSWAAIGLSGHKIAVNVSPSMLKVQGLVDLIERCLATTGCDPRQLVIEITEEALIDEADVIAVLMALRKRGVTTALDDFGKGYSSMARLKNLPIDVLKIDRSFLTNIEDDTNNAAIVESMVNVGHGLGKEVVAEGVETAEQLRFLENIGCDVAQGFFINRPMAARDIPRWFAQRRPAPPCCQTKSNGNAIMTEARAGRIEPVRVDSNS